MFEFKENEHVVLMYLCGNGQDRHITVAEIEAEKKAYKKRTNTKKPILLTVK